MLRFRIEHPVQPDLHCYAGHDRLLGFFCDVMSEGREKPIKALDMFTADRPITLIDALDFICNQGFASHEALEDALLFMRDEDPEHGTPEALRIVEIIESFKAE